MKIVNVDAILNRFEAKIVSGAMYVAAAHTAAGQPGSKSIVVVVATIDLALIGALFWQFDGGCATQFTPPHHERLFQHAALFEITQQGVYTAVALPRQSTVPGFNIVVIVPGLPCSVPDLNIAHAMFDQPPLDYRWNRHFHASGTHSGVHAAMVRRVQ